MKRPSFQFYPADWLRDTALRSCSIGARGLWMDMICFMHEGNPYGHLKVGNKVIHASNLCGMVGATLEDVKGWLYELSQAGVYDIAEDGSMYSRRMIKDENLRNMRAAGGKLGGNPALKDKPKVNLKDKQNPTPSSSSSSSSSTSLVKDTAAKAPAPKKVDRKIPMPENFGISERVQQWADKNGFDRLDEHLESLKRKTAANGYKKISWDDFFMEAIREDWAKLRTGRAQQPQQKTFAERDREAGMARWEEMTGRVHPDRQKANDGHVIDVTPSFLEIER